MQVNELGIYPVYLADVPDKVNRLTVNKPINRLLTEIILEDLVVPFAEQL